MVQHLSRSLRLRTATGNIKEGVAKEYIVTEKQLSKHRKTSIVIKILEQLLLPSVSIFLPKQINHNIFYLPEHKNSCTLHIIACILICIQFIYNSFAFLIMSYKGRKYLARNYGNLRARILAIAVLVVIYL